MKSKCVPDAEIKVTTDQPSKRKTKKPTGGARKTTAHVEQKWVAYLCFIALLISRTVELELNRKYTLERIVETLRQVECSYDFQNYWLFNYVDEVTEDIKMVFDMDFSKKRMTLQEIKQGLGSAKKR